MIKPLTKTAWEEMNEKARWDIVVALRGPDSNYGEAVKWFTASVIRGKMVSIFNSHGLVNKGLNLVVLPAGNEGPAEAEKKSGWNYHHFLSHIRTAAEWLSVPVLYIEDEFWHKIMRKPSAAAAIEDILRQGEAYNEEEKKSKAAAGADESPLVFRRSRLLYNLAGLAELKRHMEEGEVAF